MGGQCTQTLLGKPEGKRPLSVEEKENVETDVIKRPLSIEEKEKC
jgi:hypothetical protein